MQTWDFIIVGAGSAGCVLAQKLSADGKAQVLLIEAGPADTSPMVDMPKGFAKLVASPDYAYQYEAHPGSGGKNAPETWLRGKMLGGSSSINGLQYQRGHPEDYDHWKNDLGLAGWGWDEMGRIFRSMESHELGATEIRGGSGPLNITVTKNRTLLMDKLIEAGEQLGILESEDSNGMAVESIGYINATIRKGQRWSSARAFLKPARGRPNLKVLTGTQVRRIIIENGRALGVECRADGADTEHRGGEIIVSAGAIESPKLLQLSGIGPTDLLKRHGVEVVVDSPNVGRNLREHLVFTIQFRLSGKHSQNPQYSGWRLGLHGVRYLLNRTGLLAHPPYDVTAFVKAAPDAERPDAQIVAAPMSMDLAAWEGFDKGVKLERKPGAQMLGYALRPKSQGFIEITSADPDQPPFIVHNYLTHEDDRKVAVETVRFMRKLFSQPALAPFVEGETLPGAEIDSDEGILEAYNSMSGPGYHAAGSCSMGSTEDSVLDERLRVRGVEGLRVVDLSVFPTLVSGNTNGPVMALAWRAAEIIAGEREPARNPAEPATGHGRP